MKKLQNPSIRFSMTDKPIETISNEQDDENFSELNNRIIQKMWENMLREQQSIEFAKKFHCP